MEFTIKTEVRVQFTLSRSDLAALAAVCSNHIRAFEDTDDDGINVARQIVAVWERAMTLNMSQEALNDTVSADSVEYESDNATASADSSETSLELPYDWQPADKQKGNVVDTGQGMVWRERS